MKIIHRTPDVNISEIDKGCRYKFDWSWLEEMGEDKNLIGNYIRKVDVAGKVLCEWCDDPINYANRGRQAVIDHSKTKKHCDNAKIRSTNYALSSKFFASSSKASSSSSDQTYGIHPAFKQFIGKSNDTEDVPQQVQKPITPVMTGQQIYKPWL